MCEALARALQLDEVERQHLRTLARPASRRRNDWERPEQPEPGLLRVMAAFEHLPVLLLGRRSEVLARNALLDAVLGVQLEIGTPFVRWLLLDAAARTRIVNWDDFARAAVGSLRYESGQRPADSRLAALVAQLREGSAEVGRWWDDHTVTDRTSIEKVVAHPSAGQLRFHVEAVTVPNRLDQRLVVYTVEPGSATAGLLPLLGSWGTSAETLTS